MHRSSLLLVFLLFNPLFVQAADVPRHPMPNRLDAAEGRARPPIWISARDIVGANKQLNLEQLPPGDRFIVADNLKRNPAGKCEAYLGAPPAEDFLARNTLDDLLSNALVIVAGQVVDIDTGLHNALPGSLLRIAITDRLRQYGRFGGESAFVFLPGGEIRTSSGTVCSMGFSSLPSPKVGDRVLLFAYSDPPDRDRQFLEIPEPQQLLLERDSHLYGAPSIVGPITARTESRSATLQDVLWAARENAHINDLPRVEAIR